MILTHTSSLVHANIQVPASQSSVNKESCINIKFSSFSLATDNVETDSAEYAKCIPSHLYPEVEVKLLLEHLFFY